MVSKECVMQARMQAPLALDSGQQWVLIEHEPKRYTQLLLQ